jgi:hypothetical protein
MSERGIRPEDPLEDGPETKGPNIVVLYALLALGLLAAMGFAWMVVLPFYHRH